MFNVCRYSFKWKCRFLKESSALKYLLIKLYFSYFYFYSAVAVRHKVLLKLGWRPYVPVNMIWKESLLYSLSLSASQTFHLVCVETPVRSTLNSSAIEMPMQSRKSVVCFQGSFLVVKTGECFFMSLWMYTSLITDRNAKVKEKEVNRVWITVEEYLEEHTKRAHYK